MERFRLSKTPPPGSISTLNRSLTDLNSSVKRPTVKQNILNQSIKREVGEYDDLNTKTQKSRPSTPSTTRAKSYLESRSLSAAGKKPGKNVKSRIDSGIKAKKIAQPTFIPILKGRSNFESSKSYIYERSQTPNMDSKSSFNGVDYLTQEARLKRKQGTTSPIKAIKDFFSRISKSSNIDLIEVKEKLELVQELVLSYKVLSAPNMQNSFEKMSRTVKEIQFYLEKNEFIPMSLLLQCDEIIDNLEAQNTVNPFSPGSCTRKGLEEAENDIKTNINRVTARHLKEFRSNKLPNHDILNLTHAFLVLVSEVDSGVAVSSSHKVMKSNL